MLLKIRKLISVLYCAIGPAVRAAQFGSAERLCAWAKHALARPSRRSPHLAPGAAYRLGLEPIN